MISWDIAINIVGTMIIVAFMALVITAFVMRGLSKKNAPVPGVPGYVPPEKGRKIEDIFLYVGLVGFVGSIAGLSFINYLLDKRLKSREKDI